MISVVICSINKSLAAQVKRNIDNTIGVPWELILLDNTQLKKGITEVYNIGGAQSKFDVLCFVHEDVLFRTNDWGKKIIHYFQDDPKLGLVGIAGSKYKSKTLSGWATGIKEFDCCNILHVGPKGNEQRIFMKPDDSGSLVSTVTIDGVFMCSPKKVWNEIRFDEEMKGFHVYDISYSFKVSRKFKVAVTFEIDITHLTTGGDYGNSWLIETYKWHKKNHVMLPAAIEPYASLATRNWEKIIMKNWLIRLKGERITLKNRLAWLNYNSSGSIAALWPHVILFFLFRLLKVKAP